MEIDVPGDVAPSDAAEVDRVVVSRIDDHTLEALLEARPRRRAEVGLEVGHPQQHADVGRDEAVVHAHTAGEGPPDVGAPERADVELDGARLQVLVGKLLEERLGG